MAKAQRRQARDEEVCDVRSTEVAELKRADWMQQGVVVDRDREVVQLGRRARLRT